MKHVKTVSHKRPAVAIASIGIKAIIAAALLGKDNNN
jgi:hypothetical protein